jgi:sialic acid synthase SpsE
MKIITELCQNHNGDLEILESMIKASASNSDILKIQSIKADTLTYREEYEKFRRYEDEYERFKNIELTEKAEKFFIDKCKENNVESMTTVFTPKHKDYFNNLGYDNLKLSGYSIPYFHYGLALTSFKFKTLFFSTSSLTLEEIDRTVKNLRRLKINFYMMHCVCVYPTPLEKANIQNIPFLKERFSLKNIGYSDHSNPYEDNLLTTKLAIFQGAEVVERHFTILDKDKTRDGKVSITPEMLKELRRFSSISKEEQYKELNKFNDQQIFNHDYYRGRFK